MGKIIAVDFDGICVKHEFPDIGPDVPGAVDTLKALVARGDRLILWTVRSDGFLAEAVAWFEQRDIPLWGVNENPEQATWSSSPKVFADAYVDDAAVGGALIHEAEARPFVDWVYVWFKLGLPDDDRVRHICLGKGARLREFTLPAGQSVTVPPPVPLPAFGRTAARTRLFTPEELAERHAAFVAGLSPLQDIPRMAVIVDEDEAGASGGIHIGPNDTVIALGSPTE